MLSEAEPKILSAKLRALQILDRQLDFILLSQVQPTW